MNDITGRSGQAAAAKVLRDLHRPGTPLVLANIWDAASARLAERAGYAAIATSSGAVAESLGYSDGQHAPVDEMFAAAARIARVVSVPVTVDAEGGYGLPADDFVRLLLRTGAVGCNVEDTDHSAGGLLDPATHAGWLAGVRAAADAAGVPLVINARVDTFARAPRTADRPVDEAALLDDALHRARAYLAAGADCVYPIVMRDPAVIERLTSTVTPVNLLSTPDGLTPTQLAELGAARVSMGTSVWRATQSALADRLAELATG
jgi:2-methylisocitrate lyase-like PEP mutase family enzyme